MKNFDIREMITQFKDYVSGMSTDNQPDHDKGLECAKLAGDLREEIIQTVSELQQDNIRLKTSPTFSAELMSILYKRIHEVILAKHGERIDYVQMRDDGSLNAIKVDCRSGYDNDEYDVNYEDLSSDLDKIVAERLIKENEEREQQRIINEQRSKQQAIEDTEKRRQQYLKLKIEFEK